MDFNLNVKVQKIGKMGKGLDTPISTEKTFLVVAITFSSFYIYIQKGYFMLLFYLIVLLWGSWIFRDKTSDNIGKEKK